MRPSRSLRLDRRDRHGYTLFLRGATYYSHGIIFPKREWIDAIHYNYNET